MILIFFGVTTAPKGITLRLGMSCAAALLITRHLSAYVFREFFPNEREVRLGTAVVAVLEGCVKVGARRRGNYRDPSRHDREEFVYLGEALQLSEVSSDVLWVHGGCHQEPAEGTCHISYATSVIVHQARAGVC